MTLSNPVSHRAKKIAKLMLYLWLGITLLCIGTGIWDYIKNSTENTLEFSLIALVCTLMCIFRYTKAKQIQG
jgi:uncharacterized membrane protein